MKLLTIMSILAVSTILVGTACKKQTIAREPESPAVLRKVQYGIYTDKDFSTSNNNIVFTLIIANSSNQNIWDSVLAPMKIKDIPDLAHKIVIEKSILANVNTLLKVGFYYSIENVGNSSHVDSFNGGEIFKTFDFNFQ
jgi:hypothetical protein